MQSLLWEEMVLPPKEPLAQADSPEDTSQIPGLDIVGIGLGGVGKEGKISGWTREDFMT